MSSSASSRRNENLRHLPSVDALLRTKTARTIAQAAGEGHTVCLARDVVANLRSALIKDENDAVPLGDILSRCEAELNEVWRSELLLQTRKVINATGVVIHTNLGRAPLSEAARTAIAGAAGYCTLEYDLATGKRGKRGRRAEALLAELTGAESVLIVNNCAAAAFFVLTTFAGGGEVIISRGELVEIGGDFRIPDVLIQSGATLREVGTTNRTKIVDYERALNSSTRMILRVHPSNYRIVGFTAMPSREDLAAISMRQDILLYEDLGSGALIDLSSVGLKGEPVVKDSIAAGVDLVSFSSDKLLGGPQAGIIAGKADLVERLRSHPLYRALRVDKFTYAALEATLEIYRRDAALHEIPVLKMLAAGYQELTARAEHFVSQVSNPAVAHKLLDGTSAIGGGAAPAVELASKLIALTHSNMTTARLEQRLRMSSTPVITRIVDGRVMVDLRTVAESDEVILLEILNGLS